MNRRRFRIASILPAWIVCSAIALQNRPLDDVQWRMLYKKDHVTVYREATPPGPMHTQ